MTVAVLTEDLPSRRSLSHFKMKSIKDVVLCYAYSN